MHLDDLEQIDLRWRWFILRKREEDLKISQTLGSGHINMFWPIQDCIISIKIDTMMICHDVYRNDIPTAQPQEDSVVWVIDRKNFKAAREPEREPEGPGDWPRLCWFLVNNGKHTRRCERKHGFPVSMICKLWAFHIYVGWQMTEGYSFTELWLSFPGLKRLQSTRMQGYTWYIMVGWWQLSEF